MQERPDLVCLVNARGECAREREGGNGSDSCAQNKPMYNKIATI